MMNLTETKKVFFGLVLAFSGIGCGAATPAEEDPTACKVGGLTGTVIQSDVASGSRQLCCADDYVNGGGGHCERINPLPNRFGEACGVDAGPCATGLECFGVCTFECGEKYPAGRFGSSIRAGRVV